MKFIKGILLGFITVVLVATVSMVIIQDCHRNLEKKAVGFDLSGKKLNFSYLITIPKIGVSSKITLDVDLWNSQSYLPILDNNVAHGRGTVWPGEVGASFLFAHSINPEKKSLRGVFYDLGSLSNTDRLLVINSKGEKVEFEVFDKRVVSKEGGEFVMTQSNYPLIILQTCYLPDTNNKRLLVFAKKVRVI